MNNNKSNPVLSRLLYPSLFEVTVQEVRIMDQGTC